MNSNIYNALSDNYNDIKIDINKLSTNNYFDQDNLYSEQEIILPIKKKKGRKSKKDKILEQEALEKNKVIPKLFPNLNEKIFDVININETEYFLDSDFGIIYNSNVEIVGLKKDDKYILYSDLLNFEDLKKKILDDDFEISQIIKTCMK